MPKDTFRVAALAKLRNYPDAYLYVARGVDPEGGEAPAAHGARACGPTSLRQVGAASSSRTA